MDDSGGSPQEIQEQLAHMTAELYDVMMEYCEYISTNFINMLDVAVENDGVDIHPDLKEWVEDQVKILEKIRQRDDERTVLIRTMLKTAGAKTRDNNDDENETIH